MIKPQDTSLRQQYPQLPAHLIFASARSVPKQIGEKWSYGIYKRDINFGLSLSNRTISCLKIAAPHSNNLSLQSDTIMSFSSTNNSISLDGTILIARCKLRKDDSYHKSAIDLEGNYGNDNGILRYGWRSFSHSSTNIYLDGTVLYATLRYGDDQTKDVFVDLNEHVMNSNGTLMWK